MEHVETIPGAGFSRVRACGSPVLVASRTARATANRIFIVLLFVPLDWATVAKASAWAANYSCSCAPASTRDRNSVLLFPRSTANVADLIGRKSDALRPSPESRGAQPFSFAVPVNRLFGTMQWTPLRTSTTCVTRQSTAIEVSAYAS
jgi:hypothetical protein